MVISPKFEMGQLVATPGAIEAMDAAGTYARNLVRRHLTGDWGDIHPEDTGLNEKALESGDRIFSVYKLSTGVKVWVITEGKDDEGKRQATTILLPEEY